MKFYNIRKFRKERGLTQAECAEMMGWSVKKFQKMEWDGFRLGDFLELIHEMGGGYVVPEKIFDVVEVKGELIDLTKFELKIS